MMKYKENSLASPYPRQLFMEWYHSTIPGRTLRESEVSYFLNSLQLTYYQRILQVGSLGIESGYIGKEFHRNFTLILDEADCTSSSPNVIRAKIEQWPIACGSVDTLILPHIIEFESDPHRVLNEAERVLKPEGRLFILGFNPWNVLDLLRLRQKSPRSWNTHFIGYYQIMDWLNLLKFDSEFSAGFGLSPSLAFFEPQSAWQKSIARLTPAYAVKAIKRTWTPTPIKPAWISAPGLVPGQAMAPLSCGNSE